MYKNYYSYVKKIKRISSTYFDNKELIYIDLSWVTEIALSSSASSILKTGLLYNILTPVSSPLAQIYLIQLWPSAKLVVKNGST